MAVNLVRGGSAGRNWILVVMMVVALALCASCGGKSTVPAPARAKKSQAAKGTQKPYTVFGKTYYPLPSADKFEQTGIASWYGAKFHGRKTSNGETYDMEAMTAAHKILPINTVVEVHNLDNGKTTQVRINDRGPFVQGRIIDLSRAAARKIDMLGPGTAHVEIKAVGYEVETTKVAKGQKPAPPQWGPFTVQVGAFTVESNAWRLAAKLRVDYPEVQVAKFDRGDGVFYRVRVGKVKELAAAEKLESKLKEQGFTNAYVVAWQ